MHDTLPFAVDGRALFASPVFAAEKGIEAFLPASCAPGWAMDGTVATYTPENLYKYIDGEAELYMPYGFRKAATVLYAKPDTKDIGIVVNIFEMGSLLDAFGIYANFRSPTLEQIKVGAEGFLDESQLMFYQDRYFVQIEASGAVTQEGPLFLSCAETISRNLPDGKGKTPGARISQGTGGRPPDGEILCRGSPRAWLLRKGVYRRGHDRGGSGKGDPYTSGSEEAAATGLHRIREVPEGVEGYAADLQR